MIAITSGKRWAKGSQRNKSATQSDFGCRIRKLIVETALEGPETVAALKGPADLIFAASSNATAAYARTITGNVRVGVPVLV